MIFEFLDFNILDIIVLPIKKDYYKHNCVNSTLFYIIKPIDKEQIVYCKDFVTEGKTFVYDKKEMLHFKNIENCHDLKLNYYLQTNHEYKLDIPIQYQFYNYDNSVIPESIHSKLFIQLLDLYSKFDYSVHGYNKYNNEIIPVIVEMEKSKIKIDLDIFNKEYSKNYTDSYLYSNYNLYTTTGRPSNSFDNINLSALKNNSKQREMIIPKNDYLMEIDFSSFHLNILAKLINFNINGNIHKYLGKIYFQTESLTDEQYKQAKDFNFQLLYGEIPNDLNIEFLDTVKSFINRLWDFGNSKKLIISKETDRVIKLKNIHNNNPNKLLNYYLQLLEFEILIFTIKDIIFKLRNKKSKLILYVYDSFIFDFDKTEYLFIVELLSKLQYDFTIKIGKNYNEMKTINI